MSVKCCCYLHCKSHSRTILIMCDHFFPEDDPSLMSSIMGAVASQKRFVSCSVWWILSSLACSSFCSKTDTGVPYTSMNPWWDKELAEVGLLSWLNHVGINSSLLPA